MAIEGNKKTDEEAKEVAERLGTWRCSERLASLAHVSRTITERKWNEVRHWFRVENNRRPPQQRAQYHPAWRVRAQTQGQ